MARREYLSPEERTRFDTPPALTLYQRPLLVDLPAWAETYLDATQTPTNKVGFLLQLGYFRVTTRFYSSGLFPFEVVDWLTRQLRLDPNGIDLFTYSTSRTAYRHREEILLRLGYVAFDAPHRAQLIEEAGRLAHLQTRPTLMLDTLAGFLRDGRVEIPPYSTLRSALTDALDAQQTRLETLIDTFLQPHQRMLLENLLEKNRPPQTEANDGPTDLSRMYYRLTGLKRISQSVQPGHIQQRVALFTQLQSLFTQLAPLIVDLDLSDDAIRYYAQYVLDTQSKQSADRRNERYLRLIAFLVHQYLSVGDALVLTFRQALTSLLNESEVNLKEGAYHARQTTAHLVGQVLKRSDVHVDALSQIETIVDNPDTEDAGKVALIRQVLHQKRLGGTQLTGDTARLQQLKEINESVADREDYFSALERISVRLQARVSGLVGVLQFDQQGPTTGWAASLRMALNLFQQRKGELTGCHPPLDFLDMDERQRVYSPTGKLRVSLYKVLLFRHLGDGLRNGSINVLSSYEFRAFDEYLLARRQWQAHRQAYLTKARLTAVVHPAPTLFALGERLNEGFAQTNRRLPINGSVFFDKAGQWHLHRYEADEESLQEAARLLYPTNRVIALNEVLLQVNGVTGFLDEFIHQGIPQKPTRPDERLLVAAVMGYGANIGIRKMGLISKNISVNSLETVATHYFSPEGVLRANDRILTQSNDLPLTDQFRRVPGFIHTGSDGQKYDVSGPLLRASASFKYFGNGQGITIYSHLDEAGQLIYSTAFSAADRESPYMLDAITYNEVITPDAHSTDTHGSTEPVFGVTGLLGVDFRPRYARIHRQQLFSLDAVSTYKQQGYRILPKAKVDYENLVSQWEEVLRFVATIKLGYAKASQLFKRLNSYDRHHPLYRALRDLGRLYKTLYILRYLDDADLRASVERMLSRVEHANRFAKAIVLGNMGQFQWVTYHEQLVAEGCKRLIMNAINYWNLLYLTYRLSRCTRPLERHQMLNQIVNSNTHTWHHINLQGEYDFSDERVSPTVFDLKQTKTSSSLYW